jgi:hypothetical protein
MKEGKKVKSSYYLSMHSWPLLILSVCMQSIANLLKFCSPYSFSLSCVSLFEWFVPIYFLKVLNLVHVPPPPIITYLIIH